MALRRVRSLQEIFPEACVHKDHALFSLISARLLVTKQFEIEKKDIVRQAAGDYARGKGGLAGYIIGRIDHERGCDHTVTFDRGLGDASGFEVLE